jgi:hypothetical protein
VFPRGQKLPLCVTCAIGASGVRVSGTPTRSKREIRARSKAREREVQANEPAALPAIANPIPAGWAVGDHDEDAPPAAETTSKRRARKRRDRDDGPPGSPAEGGTAKGSSDMMAWLDSVYSPEP